MDMSVIPPEGDSLRPCRGHRRGDRGTPGASGRIPPRYDAGAHAGSSSSILCEGSAKLSSVKSNEGGSPNGAEDFGPIANLRSPGGRTRGSPRSRGHSEPAFATTRTPVRLIHYNPEFLPLSSEAMPGSPDDAREQLSLHNVS